MTARDRDERDLTSTSYVMALIELGPRVTRWIIANADDEEQGS